MTYISSILTVLLSAYHFQRSKRGIHSLLLASNFLHADALDRAPGSHVPRAIPSLSQQLVLFASFLARILVTLQYLLFGAYRIVFDIRCLFFFPPPNRLSHSFICFVSVSAHNAPQYPTSIPSSSPSTDLARLVWGTGALSKDRPRSPRNEEEYE